MINPILRQYHLQHRYYNIFKGNPVLEKRIPFIEQNIRFAKILIQNVPSCCNLNEELALFCTEHFYDGYVVQYKLLGSLDTNATLPTSTLGLNQFNCWLKDNALVSPIDEDIQVFRDVLLYYENPELCSAKASKPYVTMICGIECFSEASKYMTDLALIKKTDLKGYARRNPNLNQRFVMPCFINQYKNGEIIQNQCSTYAEYTLLVATMMTSCLKHFPFVADLLLQPAYGYESIVEGYNTVFQNALSPKLAKKAYKYLLSYLE